MLASIYFNIATGLQESRIFKRIVTNSRKKEKNDIKFLHIFINIYTKISH